MTLRSSERAQVVIVGADRATLALLEEWLLADGIDAVEGRFDDPLDQQPRCGGEIVLADVAFPRDQGVEFLHKVAAAYPGTPIVALSSGFFASVDCSGPCAKRLGVAGVLPKPVPRETLIDALRKLLPPRE